MPNKTIYVSDDDLPLLDQAQALADGSLSAAVSRALHRFVEVESAQRAGFEEVTVRVGPTGGRRKKRFLGYRIARWWRPSDQPRQRLIDVYSLYRTRGGRFAVHRQEMPAWFAWFDPEHPPGGHRGPSPFGPARARRGHCSAIAWDRGDVLSLAGSATLDVYDDLEAMQGHVPDEFLELARREGDEPPLEDLDI